MRRERFVQLEENKISFFAVFISLKPYYRESSWWFCSWNDFKEISENRSILRGEFVCEENKRKNHAISVVTGASCVVKQSSHTRTQAHTCSLFTSTMFPLRISKWHRSSGRSRCPSVSRDPSSVFSSWSRWILCRSRFRCRPRRTPRTRCRWRCRWAPERRLFLPPAWEGDEGKFERFVN